MDNWAQLITLAVVVLSAVGGVTLGLAQLIRCTVTFEHKTLKNEGDIAVILTDIAEIRKDNHNISVRLAVVETTASTIQKILTQRAPVHTSSPLVLNDVGREVAKGIDADDLAQRYAHTVKLPKDANAYHIQEICIDYARGDLLGAMKKEDRERVELYAFDAGDDVFVAQTVLGVKLRDVILKERGLYTKKLDASNVA